MFYYFCAHYDLIVTMLPSYLNTVISVIVRIRFWIWISTGMWCNKRFMSLLLMKALWLSNMCLFKSETFGSAWISVHIYTLMSHAINHCVQFEMLCVNRHRDAVHGAAVLRL